MVYNNSFRNQENQPTDAVREPLPRVEAYKNDTVEINVNIYDSLQGQWNRDNSSVQDEKQTKPNQPLKPEEKSAWESKTCQPPTTNGCLENQPNSRRGNYVLANIGYSAILRSEVEAINQARYNYNVPLPPGFVRPPPPPFRPIPSNQVYVQVPPPAPPIPRSFYIPGNNQNVYQDPKNKDFPPLKPPSSEEKCCSHAHLHQGNISFPPYIYPHWKPTSYPPNTNSNNLCTSVEKQYYVVEAPFIQQSSLSTSNSMNITEKSTSESASQGGLPDNLKSANSPTYNKYNPPFVRAPQNESKSCTGVKEAPLPDFGCFYEGSMTANPNLDTIPTIDLRCECAPNRGGSDGLSRSLTPVHIGGLLTLPKAEDEAEKLNPSNPKEVLSGSSSPRDLKKHDYSILREDEPIKGLVIRGCTVIEKIVTHYNIKSSNVDIKKFSKTVRVGLASRKNVIQIETLIRELILAFLHIASSWVSMRSFLSVSIENQTILENCVDPLAEVFQNWKVASRMILERMITSLQNICVEHEKYMPELCKKRGDTQLITCPDGNSDGNESDSTAGSTAWSSSDSDHAQSDDSLKTKEEKDSKLRPKNRKSSDEETPQNEPNNETNVYPLQNPENEKSKSTTFVPPVRLSKMWASPKRRQNNSSYMFNNFSSYTPHSQKSLCYGNRSKEGSMSNRDISRDSSKSYYDKYHSSEIKPNEMWRKPVMEEPQKQNASINGSMNKGNETVGSSYRTPTRTYKDVIQQGLNAGREKGPEWKSAVESSVETLSNILKKSPPPSERPSVKTTGLKYSDACSGRLEDKSSQSAKNERKAIYLSRSDVEGEWRKSARKELKSTPSQTDDWKPPHMNKEYSGLVIHSDMESTSEKCEPLLLPKNSEVHPVDINVKYKILDILGFVQSSNLEGFLGEDLSQPVVTKLKDTVLHPLFSMSYWVYNDVYSNLMDLLDEIYAIFFKARCVNKGNLEVMLTVSKLEMKLIRLLHNELNTC